METRSVEAASLSARKDADRQVRVTEELVDQIFSQLANLEDVIGAGRIVSSSLADPIARLDGGGPTFGPEGLGVATNDAFISEPCLVEKLEKIRDRISHLRSEQVATNEITGAALSRLNVAV